jgi:hypothetical protein
MQANVERRAQGLREKIPDIEKNLDVVQFLTTRTVCEDIDFLACYIWTPFD